MPRKSMLVTLRKLKRLSREELAERLDVSENSIGRYERGERLPPTEILGDYAKALGVTVEALMDCFKGGKGQ